MYPNINVQYLFCTSFDVFDFALTTCMKDEIIWSYDILAEFPVTNSWRPSQFGGTVTPVYAC